MEPSLESLHRRKKHLHMCVYIYLPICVCVALCICVDLYLSIHIYLFGFVCAIRVSGLRYCPALVSVNAFHVCRCIKVDCHDWDADGGYVSIVDIC